LLLACALFASAAVSNFAAAKNLKIAVIPKGTTHEFWKAIHCGAAKAQRPRRITSTRNCSSSPLRFGRAAMNRFPKFVCRAFRDHGDFKFFAAAKFETAADANKAQASSKRSGFIPASVLKRERDFKSKRLK